jgi:integrase
MAIVRRGVDTYLVRVYMGRDPLTGKRIEVNETMRGSLASAKKLEAKIKGQKESGRIAKTQRMSLDRLFDLYLESARHCQAASTQNKNRKFLDKYARPYVGSTPLRKVTCQLLQDLFNLLMDEKKDGGGGGRGLAPNTVKIIRKLLAAAFNHAVRQKLIAENPVTGTRLPRVPESKANSLTFKDAEALVSVKDHFWYGDAFVFQLYTGLRPQELMALIWEDVDFDRGTLRVERACKWIDGVFTGFGMPKTRMSARTIKLSPAALDLLRNHYEKRTEAVGARNVRGEHYGEPKINEWSERERPRRSKLYASAELIFSSPTGGVHNSVTPRVEFKEALRRAGVTVDYRWYDLRHTHASFLIKLGVALTDVATRMGHTLAELVHTYAHHIEDERSDGPEWLARLTPV